VGISAGAIQGQRQAGYRDAEAKPRPTAWWRTHGWVVGKKQAKRWWPVMI